ncbi:MAG: DUF3991 and toprim domain-containing protein [Faecalibacterium sp.]|nr:DUF3991 and toprim domain-containing protein [Ruminococcus flavefaciens]MCM1391689.1 DUF3991 and toprim domain-containing protein [Ruminococcus sp.]MCM1484641.1 DUF3991 and toprim domain-containing protein [Faecalibacterium sp.]
MSYFSKEEIANAKKLDLLTYLQIYDPDELVKLSTNVYSTRTHDSLKISNGLWMWWSRGIGGRSALDYLVKVQGLSLHEAVGRILGRSLSAPNISKSLPKTESKVFELPEKADNNDKIIAYLSCRGISKTIIDYCIENGLIYQGRGRNNVVFVGYDKDKKAKYAAVRGTGKSRFIGDVGGSDKAFSFRLNNSNSDTLHVFEGAIDLLSYATFLQQQGFDFKSQSLVSLSGVSNGDMTKVPVAIKSFLALHDEIKRINLHLDNDKAGRRASETLIKLLSPKYEVKSSFVPVGKDVNDYLCYTLNPPFKSHKEGRDAR